jgi:hypothetical protein
MIVFALVGMHQDLTRDHVGKVVWPERARAIGFRMIDQRLLDLVLVAQSPYGQAAERVALQSLQHLVGDDDVGLCLECLCW